MFTGVGKKSESNTNLPHSDSEGEENHSEVPSIWKRRTAHQPISRQPHVTHTHTHTHFGRHSPVTQTSAVVRTTPSCV